MSEPRHAGSMSPRHWRRWFLSVAMAAALSGSSTVSKAEPSGDNPAQRQGSISGCLSPEELSNRTLKRHLGELSANNEAVASLVATLQTDYEVPLSFIEDDEDVKISFAMSGPTVEDVLARIVDLAPVYRYTTIGGHPVLYSRGTKWDSRLDSMPLGPGPRGRVASQLALELGHRLPVFAHFGTNLSGDGGSYVSQDPISVIGSGSVVEVLVQLLGTRPSAIFFVENLPGWPWAQIFLGGVHYWRYLKPTIPAGVMHAGELAQLKAIGTLEDGSSQDVTSDACGTVYWVSNKRVVTIGGDGWVNARATGKAWIQARNSDEVARMRLPGPAGRFTWLVTSM